MGKKTWTGGFCALVDGAQAPIMSGWLRSPGGLLVSTFAERISPTQRGRATAIAAARVLDLAHKRRCAEIVVSGPDFSGETVDYCSPGCRGLTVTFTGETDVLAQGLAQALVPVPAPFDPDRLEAGPDGLLIAHGGADYRVDLEAGVCTCPSFTYRRQPCKHLIAARRWAESRSA